MSDEIKISFTLKRNENGTASITQTISGGGFHYYEIIGLMQLALNKLIEQSIALGEKLNQENQCS